MKSRLRSSSWHPARASVHRVFKELTGSTPKQYADSIRADRIRQELHRGGSVTNAVYATGFNSSSRFYEKWAWILGMKPSVYRSGGAGEFIIFAVVNTQLGAMIAATTRIGVCSIAFADSADQLETELRKRFHKATVVPGDAKYRAWVENTVSCIDTPRAIASKYGLMIRC
jgi:AraC family transcriptional regulator of adaptative response/methylated-DNA-[protein]-cysteine methyltransferase